MTENGYAKPVLVTTDWLAEHLNDDSVVVAEVDENPDLYDEGHIAGAVKLHWRDDLQDPVERDLVDKPTFERLLSERRIANHTTLVLYGDGAARLRDRQELRRLVDGVGQPRRRSDRKGFLDDDRISGQSSRRVCHKTNESRSDLRGKCAALSAAKLLLSPDRAAASAAASFVSGGSWWPSHPRWEERTNQIRALPCGNNTNR